MVETDSYPVGFDVDYPDRELDRVTTLLRPLAVIPILIVLTTVVGHGAVFERADVSGHFGTGGVLFFAPLLMILFRRKYPRWWFDWNVELLRFANRVAAYIAMMDDRYPSTDDHQAVRLEVPFPNVERELSRWLPLVKWLLAIPHLVVLAFLFVGAVIAVVIAWFAILFTGRYPRGLFAFVEGVLRWFNRVVAYACILVTDNYPPFSLYSPADGSGALNETG